MELENIIGIQGAWCDKDIFTKVITDNAVKNMLLSHSILIAMLRMRSIMSSVRSFWYVLM